MSPLEHHRDSWCRGPSLGELGPRFLGTTCPCRARVQPGNVHKAEGNTSQPRGITTGCRLSWLELSKAFKEEDGPALARKGLPCLHPRPLGQSTTPPPTANGSEFALNAYLCAQHFLLETLKSRVLKPRWLIWGMASI